MNAHRGTLAAVSEPLRCYRHPNRETYVSCSDCGRGICPECMVFGPVGIRCPDHAGVAGRTAAPRRAARRASFSLSRYGPYVTFALIAINVGIYLLELVLGGSLNGTNNTIYEHGVLVDRAIDSNGDPVGVAEGEWWRLLTAAFLHYGPIHLALNMFVLWFIGPALEEYLGHGRYALMYVVSGLAGSAGALLWTPNALTVGASGAIWGVMGAALLLEWRKIYVLGGQAMGLVVLNLAITFLIPGISRGGHIGGLIGGGLAALAFLYLRRTPVLAALSVAAIGALCVALALSQV
jgi:membrane associated rhomboid family serine protease